MMYIVQLGLNAYKSEPEFSDDINSKKRFTWFYFDFFVGQFCYCFGLLRLKKLNYLQFLNWGNEKDNQRNTTNNSH